MITRTTTRSRWLALVLAVAVLLAACGGGGDDDATATAEGAGETTAPDGDAPAEAEDTSSSDVPDDAGAVDDDGAPSGEETDLSDGLPATTTYGYLDVTLDRVATTDVDPTETLTEELADDEQIVVTDLVIGNRNQEVGWSMSLGYLIAFEIDDEVYDGTNASEEVEIEPGGELEATMAFVVPADADVQAGRILLQEGRDDPDARTRPAFLGVDGEVDESFEPLEVTDAATVYVREGGGPSCKQLDVDSVRIDDEYGFKANGAQIWSGERDGFARPPEGQLFAIVFMTGAAADTDCDDAPDVGNLEPIVRTADGTPAEYISGYTTQAYFLGREPTELYFVFPIDESQRDLTFELNTDPVVGWTVEVA